MQDTEGIRRILDRIYGKEKGKRAFQKIQPLIAKHAAKAGDNDGYFSEKDVVLITYGDTLQREGEAPLATLRQFADRYLTQAVSTLHFLPFYPYSSDDGFSVIDYVAVDPRLGTWEDINAFEPEFKLMFDLVLNHISAKSPWFRFYLEERSGFADLAIEVDPSIDLSQVTRPRSLPLLTEFQKKSGTPAHLWTTFSADQIDLNYSSIDLLEKMIEVLLFYVEQGATILRLDAIAYLWKEIGTNCIHLPQTHDMVKLFRNVLDAVAPNVVILTETNVPHEENISYFGKGGDEAQMVYNFTLPPLLLHAFGKGDTGVLSEWARGLRLESEATTFFNFTASHDGIGVRPLEGILPPEAFVQLTEAATAGGGQVSFKKNPDGSQSPYELNITYVDAILGDRTLLQAERFLASQSIQYVLPGVPATYIHSLLGARNWVEGVQQTGRARTINREKLDMDQVVVELETPGSFRAGIFHPYVDMIKIRRNQKAFHPNAPFEVLDVDSRVFAVKRHKDDQVIFALTNISSDPVPVSLAAADASEKWTDLISGSPASPESMVLKPYQFVWLSNVVN